MSPPPPRLLLTVFWNWYQFLWKCTELSFPTLATHSGGNSRISVFANVYIFCMHRFECIHFVRVGLAQQLREKMYTFVYIDLDVYIFVVRIGLYRNHRQGWGHLIDSIQFSNEFGLQLIMDCTLFSSYATHVRSKKLQI